MPPGNQSDASSASRGWRRGLIGAVVAVAVGVAVWLVFRDVPWAEVGAALRGIEVWQALALLGLVLVRAVVLALPLNLLMPEITPVQAARSDLVGNLVANFAPPPADIGVRVAMFRSWRLDVTPSMASLTLSAILFYAGRFAAPMLGFVVILLTRRFDEEYLQIALLVGLVAAAIIGALIALSRARRSAAWLAQAAARLAGRVRTVDADAWERAVLDFREQVNDRLQRRWAGAALAVVVLLLFEAFILEVCMRFMGVPAEAVVTAEVMGAFLITYPLNMLPFGGIVILDAALLELLVLQGGGDYEAQITAGLVLWRLATLVTPFVLGALALVHWQRTDGRGIAWRSAKEVEDPA